MKYYNLYSKDLKLNNRPINEEELENIMKAKKIGKRDPITGKLVHIPINQIKVIKTILI